MEQENQRIMLTKRLLKESMLRLLQERPLEKISITELCRNAGINRATFYRHYEIPRDVLNEIGKDIFYEMRKELEMPKFQSDIKAFIEKLCLFMENNMDIMRTIIKSSTETDFITFVNSIYKEIWIEIRKLRILSNLKDVEIELLILYSAGGSYFMLRQWLLGSIRMSSKEVADYLYKLLSLTDWSRVFDQLGLME